MDVNPRLGLFVIRGLAINANLQLGYVSGGSYSSWRWGIGPGVTYYFGGPTSRVYPFLTGRTLFVRTHSTWSEGDIRAATTDVAWLAGGGVVLMLVKHVGLSAELFYQRSKHTLDSDTSEPVEAQWYGLRIGVAAFLF
jgi:hypothetical protein